MADTSNIKHPISGQDIHNSVLRFLEEGAIDLVCIATDLDFNRCSAMREKWGVEEGTKCNCWLEAYKAMYGVDALVDADLVDCGAIAK